MIPETDGLRDIIAASIGPATPEIGYNTMGGTVHCEID